MGALAAVLLAILALPFDPFWLDFEAARRDVLLLAAGGLALTAPLWLRARPGIGFALALALVAWHLLRSVGVTNPVDGLHRALHLAALTAVFVFGARVGVSGALRAALPACLAVSVFGLAQAAGWSWPPGYGSPTALVSTLGNTNFASEFVAVTAAAAAVLVGRRERTAIAAVTLAIATAYLLVNGSRSGLVALPLAGIAVLADRTVGRRARIALIAALFAGTATGLLTRVAKTDAPPPPAATAPLDGAPSTIDVRLEIWRACATMAGDAPLLGHGSGQFKVVYPAYRTQREIELSTFGRRFEARPQTAHNDPLEILTETGVVGLALALAFVLAGALPHRHSLGSLAPIVAFAALSLVRAPLGNAPAAAFALLQLGSLASGSAARPPARAVVAAVAVPFGLLALYLGASGLIAAHHAAAYQQQIAKPDAQRGAQRAALVAILERACHWNGSDPRFYRLLAQERFALGSPTDRTAALADWRTAAALDPDDTASLVGEANHLQALGNPTDALKLLQRVLEIDPREPQATLLAARILCRGDEVARALALLYRDPHPRLRAVLADHLAVLATIAESTGDMTGAAVLEVEHAFVAALDALAEPPSNADRAMAAKSAIERLRALQQQHDALDLRPFALLAIQALHVDAPDVARGAAEYAQRHDLSMTDPHRRLLAPLANELREDPAWRALLERE